MSILVLAVVGALMSAGPAADAAVRVPVHPHRSCAPTMVFVQTWDRGYAAPGAARHAVRPSSVEVDRRSPSTEGDEERRRLLDDPIETRHHPSADPDADGRPARRVPADESTRAFSAVSFTILRE